MVTFDPDINSPAHGLAFPVCAKTIEGNPVTRRAVTAVTGSILAATSLLRYQKAEVDLRCPLAGNLVVIVLGVVIRASENL